MNDLLSSSHHLIFQKKGYLHLVQLTSSRVRQQWGSRNKAYPFDCIDLRKREEGATLRRLASIVAALTHQKWIRLGYSCLNPDPQDPLFCSPLSEGLSLSPCAAGCLIPLGDTPNILHLYPHDLTRVDGELCSGGVTSPEWEPIVETVKPGDVLFFDTELSFPLFEGPCSSLFLCFVPHGARFLSRPKAILNKKTSQTNPLVHSLKTWFHERGYSFGDALQEPHHPILT